MVQLLVRALQVRLQSRDGEISPWYTVIAIDEADHRGRYLLHRSDVDHAHLRWVSRDTVVDVAYEPLHQGE
jgi:hypothetical protein